MRLLVLVLPLTARAQPVVEPAPVERSQVDLSPAERSLPERPSAELSPRAAEEEEAAPARVEAPAPPVLEPPASSAPATRSKAAAVSSLYRFVEDVAAALEGRARAEGVSGAFHLDISGARGIDARKADREFGARLRRRLRDGGVLLPVSASALRARLVLSQEHGRVWAVGVLEGGRLPGPSALAVSASIDRELEVALGASARQGQRSWGIERLGAVPAGVLDVALVDVDGDIGDEIVLLGVDGVRIYRYAAGDARPELLAGPVPLPERPWPRVVVGWMAPTSAGKLWIATSAGHALRFDPKTRQFEDAPRPGAPLRQPKLPSQPGERLLLAGLPFGSPLLMTPPTSAEGTSVDAGVLPNVVRDLVQWPGREGAWLWVDGDGRLGGRLAGRRPVLLPVSERAGDRVLLVDLNADGDLELVTSSAAAPGESDLLTIYQLAAGFETASVVYRTPLSGGSIAALASGELDYDSTPDLLLVEEDAGDAAVLWRLEYAP